jgi:methyl-accepting chemotaxis protein
MIILIFAPFLLSPIMNNINQRARKAYFDEIYENSSLLLNADRDFYQAEIAENSLVLGRDSLSQEEKEKLVADYHDNASQVLERMETAIANLKMNGFLMNEMKNSESGLTFAEIYEDFKSHFKEWEEAYEPETGSGNKETKNIRFEEARAEIDNMNGILEEYAVFTENQIEKSVRKIIVGMIAVIIIVFFAITAFALITIHYIRNNITNLTQDMNLLANNDLSFDAHKVNRKDEIGKLTGSVSVLISSLRDIISKISQTSEQLTNSSYTMRVNSGEVTSSMNEIARTVSEIAEGAGSQAEDTERLVNEIGMLGEVVNENSESAKELTTASKRINKASQAGLKAVNDLSEITYKNQESFQSIFDIIEITNENANKIGEASNIIAGIVKQTKLLALNASIEAARAGEMGKGFAVVAAEISKLSEQSEISTKTIASMLQVLKDNVTVASNQSNIVKEAVAQQTNSVNETKEKYLAIVDNLQSINKAITTMENVSLEMEKSRLSVTGIGTNLSAISEEYAASTEETSATTQEVLAAMTTINEVVEEVDTMVIELKSLMDKFKLS